MKLITILIQEGVLILNRIDHYALLYDIYHTSTAELTTHQLETFESILKQASVHPPKLFRLLGDEIGDRGKNDYFTFLVIKNLKQAGLNLEIIFSNHASVAIQRLLEGKNGRQVIGAPGINQQQSCDFFWQLVESQLISYEDIFAFFNHDYLSSLKLIGYQWRFLHVKPTLHLYTHAPIGLETIKDIAVYFDVTYADNTPQALIQTLDSINATLVNSLSTQTFKRYYDIESPSHNPIYAILWSRHLRDHFTLIPSGNFFITATHGHVGANWTPNFPPHHVPPPILTNLDNMLGKTDELFSGQYPILMM